MVRRVIPGLVVLLAGCPLEGDGALTERVDEVAWFDALEVFSDFEVEAAVDPALAGAKTLTVTVTGESNLLERLFAGVHGEGVLSIAVDPNLLSKTTIRPKASLTAPALRSVYAADRAKVTVSGASGSFAAETDELAEVTAQGLTTADAVVTARGSSAVVLAGAGPTLVIDASEACGRRIAVAGRGFEDSTRLAGELGYLRFPTGGLITVEEACRMPAHETTVLISGSQGEPTSALARLSDGQFKQLTIAPGDAVILSSRVIPGNERSVHALLNRLAKRGAVVHAGERANVHVSGHAYRDELREMIRLVKPRYFVPVHGEYRQLDEHRRLAVAMGMPQDRCFLLEDGDVLELADTGPRQGERVVAGRVLVDGSGEGEIGLEVLRDRRHLSEDGFVVAVVAIHQQTGEITQGPELITRGVLGENEGPEVLDDAKSAVLDKLREITPESRADLLEVEDEVRRVLKKYFSRSRGKRPLIVPHIFEM